MARILVVDDDDRNLRLMEALLAPLKHEVVLARNGIEALEKVEENPPDLIMLDILMPGMDGFEVARRLKSDEKRKIIPIVMVTALGGIEDRVKALDAGADDFLTKPVDKSELIARVRSLLKVKAYNDHMLNYQRELEKVVTTRTRQLQKALNSVKKASLETIHRLSRAAEYKDEDTGAHIIRMSRYAAAIASEIGLNKKTVETIFYAAPMHDVGKIGIPDRILLKAGRLSPEEWEIMKQHTIIGARILEGSSTGFIKLAEIIALTHHEKWDGTGYPRGLKGSQIPLAGRIAALADVFDALTSKRPYKKPLSIEESLEIIREESGKHFDPRLVKAFLNIKDEILSIKEKYRDQGESLFAKMTRGDIGTPS